MACLLMVLWAPAWIVREPIRGERVPPAVGSGLDFFVQALPSILRHIIIMPIPC
ncbi:MAG: hypothetical protein HQL80_02105 [Magnetococcales bacterium]|nr:hypothetical protein [Magnetococcales bacterium]